ncbi:hypothetical protein QFZ35_002500 [Arthrobacter ulcerisalmonis]|uniref:DUF6993 domain-containing protein n=1 Tax=Arthrobacter sp. B1I2 TaxID=3042263 RepID=UPI002785E7CC|nr:MULTISPECIES: hypothetical protein [Arthrobacter]MDQ0664002.1 hypothetical protein [Arthrobacter ulcerisalmonis]MDQ0731907.1 hypothetical protein [Arthrobacter sp. B1I2]
MRPTPNSRRNNRARAALACAVLACFLSGCAAGPSGSRPAIEGSGSQASSPGAAAGPDTQGQPVEAADPATLGTHASGKALAATAGGASPAADAAATEAVKRAVTDTLTKLAAGTPKPATAQVSDALTGAGIATAVLQVSQSRTPTGLEADAIEAAVLQGKDCVIGQVREGAVTVTVLPVLASGKCFVGS